MLKYVLFELKLFDTTTGKESSRKGLLWLLEALSCWNQLFLEENPSTPKLYASGVQYAVPMQMDLPKGSPLGVMQDFVARFGKTDPKVIAAFEEIRAMCGGERFRDIPSVLDEKFVDCDNLAAFRVAELRNMGIQAMPYITWRKRDDGGYTYHALVRWPDGSSEDPSLILGMGGEYRAKERAEELRKNEERMQMIRDVFKKEKAKKIGKQAAATLALLSAPATAARLDAAASADGDGSYDGGYDRESDENDVDWGT